MIAKFPRTVIALVRLWCWAAYPRQTIVFRLKMGWWPDPAFPTHRSDKYAWRKVFDRNPLFTEVSDKLQAKAYVQRHCPDVRVAKTLWAGSSPEDIPDELLTRSVVVKANHGSSWNYLVRDGNCDRTELNRLANGWLSRRFGRRHAEWGYFGVEPLLFVEEMLFDDAGPVVNEYKFHAGNGDMAFAFVRQRGPDGTRIAGMLDNDGQVLSGDYIGGQLSQHIQVPAGFAKLRAVALNLSEEFDLVRCDLHLVGDEVYFSELTLYSDGGFGWTTSAELNQRYTNIWNLRKSWFMRTPQSGWRKIYAEALRTLLN